ncbi:MAG: hypothetical protein QM503_00665 [Bacteroidota bacterium]
MMNNNHSVSIKLQPESIRDIEIFVDTICDQLFINDTYYGNILMSLSELFNYLLDSENDTLNITYNSDYKKIDISFYPIDIQMISSLTKSINIDDIIHQESNKNIFLINSLVDNITTNSDGNLSFEFDISALHNEIYNHRSELLKKYFSKQLVVKPQKHND